MAAAIRVLIGLCALCGASIIFAYSQELKISQQYIFWAKYFTTNQILSTHEVAISKAMVKSNLNEFYKICFIKGAKGQNQSEMAYFMAHKSELEDCFINAPMHALEFSRLSLQSANMRTNVTLIPLHFIAVFKPSGATILAKTQE